MHCAVLQVNMTFYSELKLTITATSTAQDRDQYRPSIVKNMDNVTSLEQGCQTSGPGLLENNLGQGSGGLPHW